MKEILKILYAEDEDDIREIVKIALEDIGGFTIHYCANGNEALQAANHDQFDLILLDVMMPVMDGPTTLMAIRKVPGCEFTPVIFMTAKIQSQELAEYKTMGVLDVITKPFDPLLLADNIRSIWHKSEKMT